jgi:hypothetical protein
MLIIDADTCMTMNNDKTTATVRLSLCLPAERDDPQWIPAANLGSSYPIPEHVEKTSIWGSPTTR